MPIRFFNTLTRAKEVFEPIGPPHVGLYTCGPTVYNFAHIGNLRTFLFEDLLRRHLKYRGYRLTHVMNLTDVEDKIIRACRETGESLKSLTGRYSRAFFDDIDTLGVERAEVYPAATDHIAEMVDIIKKLRANGHTYEANGSIYFKLSSFAKYGQLSKFKLDELKTGASGRVDSDEYETVDARDFALWKSYDEDDGAVFWETDSARVAGWHIECSCMSMKYLGESFDIRKRNRQHVSAPRKRDRWSEAATGKPFVK